jgi:inositol-phosphate transport system substrate-binding protein
LLFRLFNWDLNPKEEKEMSRKVLVLVVVAVMLSLVAAQCGVAPTAEKVVETVVVKETVEKVVTKEVEKQVVVTKEVEVPSGGELVTLVARCKAGTVEVGRCNNLVAAAGAANAALAEAGDNRRIEVKAIQDDKDWGQYKTEFELASQAGEAPDIICSGHEHIGDWAPAGYIIPVDDMISQHPEFQDVIDSLWNSVTFQGQRWGVPQDAEARPMFFSKPILKKLGWSDEEVQSLADRVNNGEFTWEDMFDTATQAVEQGLVKEGDGWWHRPVNGPDFLYYYYAAGGQIVGEGDALLFDKNAVLKVYQLLEDATQQRKILSTSLLGMEWNNWHAAVSSADTVAFWFGGSWNWPDWAANYVADKGGEDFLFENIGFSAIPALKDGTDQPITLTHPLVYMISSESKNPDLAMLLIAKTTTKELNSSYAVESGHLGILKSQADYKPYTSAKFLSDVLPLLQYTTFLPNSPYWSQWSEAYYLGIQAVEAGDLSAADAVNVVVDQLQNELGDHVVIQ